MNKILATIILCFCLLSSNLSAVVKNHSMLLDGSETLAQYGIDSLGNWWAITSPFQNQFRVYINGQESAVYDSLTGLQFSASGEHWAYFGRDNIGWNLITDSEVISLHATDVGQIKFSYYDDVLAYSYYDGNLDYLVFGDKEITAYGRYGEFYISPDGRRYAYGISRGNNFAMNINGRETTTFDDVKPIGFWHDGAFMYVASSGTGSWELYKNEEAISEVYTSIPETKINRTGTTLGMITELSSGYFQNVLMNDEYYELLFSSQYDNMSNLTIHPYEPMIACHATHNDSYYVLLNSTEFPAEETSTPPTFTYDGSELYFLTCRISCFLSVNGKRYKIPNQLDTEIEYAKKPGSNTIAFPTSTSITMENIEEGQLYADLLIDYMSNVIYNRIEDTYEALGSIGNRLYLMQIKP